MWGSPASERMQFGRCGCEYPCSCVEFDGEQFGGWREVVDALDERLRRAVSVEDVERLLSETSRYFAGDHLNAGVVVGEMRKRLRALTGGR